MAFPTTSVLDDFNRANEGPPPSGDWTGGIEGTTSPGLIVDTNIIKIGSPFSGAGNAYWNVGTFSDPQEVFVKASTPVGQFNKMSVFMCLQSPGSAAVDGYELRYETKFIVSQNEQVLQLYRIDNNSATSLTFVIQVVSAGDSFGIQRDSDGTMHTMYKSGAGAWVDLDDANDTNYTSGNLGVLGENNTVKLDDFGGGATVAAGIRRYYSPGIWRTVSIVLAFTKLTIDKLFSII